MYTFSYQNKIIWLWLVSSSKIFLSTFSQSRRISNNGYYSISFSQRMINVGIITGVPRSVDIMRPLPIVYNSEYHVVYEWNCFLVKFTISKTILPGILSSNNLWEFVRTLVRVHVFSCIIVMVIDTKRLLNSRRLSTRRFTLRTIVNCRL